MINVKQWMALPKEVRVQIAKDFNLTKTGRMGVANNIIVSDGYSQNDILKINLENLQTVLDSTESDFDTLFVDYVKLIENSLVVVHVEIEPTITQEPEIAVVDTNEIYNPNIAQSGDTETYFGTKIKPVSYIQKPNGKKRK